MQKSFHPAPGGRSLYFHPASAGQSDVPAAWSQRSILWGAAMSIRDAIAQLTGAPLDDVRTASPDEVRQALAGRTEDAVLEATLNYTADYWHAGGSYWLVEPYDGNPVRIDDLVYDSALGLHRYDLQ